MGSPASQSPIAANQRALLSISFICDFPYLHSPAVQQSPAMPAVASTSATTEAVDGAGAPYQPFQCPTCLKRFTRQVRPSAPPSIHNGSSAALCSPLRAFLCQY